MSKTYSWSNDLAYAVGLLASDGSLSKDGRHIDLTSKDMDQLDNFSKAMGKDYYIGKKYNASRQVSFRIQFSDVSLYSFLTSIGLTPNKSLNIGALKVPDKYFLHFFRGVFDGDGSVHGYKDKSWADSYMYYLSIACASEPFLIYLKQQNKKIAKLEGGSIRRSGRAYQLSYAKKDTKLLYEAMYKGDEVVYLSRKRSKMERLMFECDGGAR